VAQGHIVLALLIIESRISIARIRLIIGNFEPLINQVSFLILPLGVDLLNTLEEYAWTVLMVVVVFLEGEHLVVVLTHMIPPLQVFLEVQEVLHILIKDIHSRPPFAHDFVDLVGVEVGLRGGILLVKETLDVWSLQFGRLSTHSISLIEISFIFIANRITEDEGKLDVWKTRRMDGQRFNCWVL
jgi:hypothetical protein